MPWSSKGKIIEDWREVTSIPIKRNAEIFHCFLIVFLNDNPNHDLLLNTRLEMTGGVSQWEHRKTSHQRFNK